MIDIILHAVTDFNGLSISEIDDEIAESKIRLNEFKREIIGELIADRNAILHDLNYPERILKFCLTGK